LIIDTAPVAPITESYPGVPLSQGAQGPDVELMQKYLNRVRQNFPYIPGISNPNGIYGADTANAVRAFQSINSLPQTGIIDRATWNLITYRYVAVTRLAQLTSEGDRIVTGTIPPNTTVSMGTKGGLVTRLQYMLTFISQFYPDVPALAQDGSFGALTKDAVIRFQNRFGLSADGVVNAADWNKIYEVYNSAKGSVPPQITPPPTGPVYPGAPLRAGSRGDSVRLMQQYLNAIAAAFPSIPGITADGIFGPLTENAVRAFQRQFGLGIDGIIGPITWNAIVEQYNSLQATPPVIPPTPPPTGPAFPGTLLRNGSRGDSVRLMQQYLNAIAAAFPSIPVITADGIFGPLTENAVRAFQRQFGLGIDGIIGPITWAAIVREYNNLQTANPGSPMYPGVPLRLGSTGESVRVMQQYMNDLAGVFPTIPRLNADGAFGPLTENAVRAFQSLFGLAVDGVIGPATWNAIVTQYNNYRDTNTLTVVIDAGHGGSDWGASSGTRREKDDNLNLALAVAQRLQTEKQRVILTRSSDVFVPLEERSEIANRNNADIFVSLHRNASVSPAANGVETFVKPNAPPINISYAQNVQNAIVSVGVQSNRGVKQENFAVLRNTQAPAMLVELGFITNERDNELFDQNFNAYADAIVRGILESLKGPGGNANGEYFNYTVQSGDTLWALAQRFGTTIEIIMQLNGLTDSNLSIGQVLRIPGA